jgi:undecaprenyl-diphosphatase
MVAFLSFRVAPIVLAVVGLLVLGGSISGAARPSISAAEARAFHAVNALPDRLYVLLWLPMQLGNLVVGVAVGLGVALALHDGGLAIAVVAATGAKFVVEHVVRDRTKSFSAVRQRPGTSEVGATLRGDVPTSGASFPSGHVILAAAIGTVLSTTLPIEWLWAPWLLVALVAVGRVYVGAHNPLDVTAGLGAGLLIGGLLDVLVR